MKIAKPHFYGALGIVLFAWLFFGLSWRNPAESANVPVLPERRSETANTRNPPLHDTVANQVRDKIATTNGIKNVSRQTTPSVLLVARMGNAGNSTVQAALETELYALRQGDPDLVASVITFDPADETKMVDLLSVVPLEIRKQYPTPERLVAFLLWEASEWNALKCSPKRLRVTISSCNMCGSNLSTIPPSTMKTWFFPTIPAAGKVWCHLDWLKGSRTR